MKLFLNEIILNEISSKYIKLNDNIIVHHLHMYQNALK